MCQLIRSYRGSIETDSLEVQPLGFYEDLKAYLEHLYQLGYEYHWEDDPMDCLSWMEGEDRLLLITHNHKIMWDKWGATEIWNAEEAINPIQD